MAARAAGSPERRSPSVRCFFVWAALLTLVRPCECAITATVTALSTVGNCWDWGDGQPLGGSTALNVPTSVCIDASGVLYISLLYSHIIREVPLVGGYMSVYAGVWWSSYFGDGGFATQAALSYPYDVYCHPNGKLFIAGVFAGRGHAA